jgi:hypothetical protein
LALLFLRSSLRLAILLAKLHVGETNGIVEIEVSGKVPLAVVGIFATNVIGVKRKERLIRGHARCTRIKQNHQVIEHVAHAVTLETELGGQIKEDVLNLLLGERNLSIRRPSRVGLSRSLACGECVSVLGAVDRRGGSR